MSKSQNNANKPGMAHTPIIPALRRLRQKRHKFKVSQGYLVRTCLKKANKKQCWSWDVAQ
jgi:hypothetical protein